MELNQMIVTEMDRQNWKEFLVNQLKEELVEIILDRMTRDIKFSREVHCKLSQTGMNVDEIIHEYEQDVKNGIEQKVPDVDFLEIISDKVMEKASATQNLLEQLRLYVSVILSLDSAVNYGAGFEMENEYILFDLMDDCLRQMLIAIEEKHNKLDEKDFGKIYDFLKSESEKYNSVDGHNRIEDVFSKLVSMTKGRKRITNTGGYVRGAEYYGNLGK